SRLRSSTQEMSGNTGLSPLALAGIYHPRARRPLTLALLSIGRADQKVGHNNPPFWLYRSDPTTAKRWRPPAAYQPTPAPRFGWRLALRGLTDTGLNRICDWGRSRHPPRKKGAPKDAPLNWCGERALD